MDSWRVGSTRVYLLGMFCYRCSSNRLLIQNSQRFLLPRITQTLFARQSLRSHYSTLLQKFTSSLSALKEHQSESYSVLPHPEPYKEPRMYSNCISISDVLKHLDENKPEYQTIPPFTLLRIAITELGRENPTPPTTEDVFGFMEDKIPWLGSQSGRVFEVRECLLSQVHRQTNLKSKANFVGNLEYLSPFLP